MIYLIGLNRVDGRNGMPDPHLAEMQEQWHEYCVDPISHDYHQFTHILTESAEVTGQLTDGELASLLKTFPERQEIGRRIRLILDKQRDGLRETNDEELVELAKSHVDTMTRIAADHGPSDLLTELESLGEPVLADRREGFRKLLADPADLLDQLDQYWWRVSSEMKDVTKAANGLKEALWGITADNTVGYHVLEPLLDRKLGLEHHMALWLRGASTGIANDGLLYVLRPK